MSTALISFSDFFSFSNSYSYSLFNKRSSTVFIISISSYFRKLYPKARAYIDCTLVQVSGTKNKEEQVLAYTDYKTMQAMKFLVACAPSGEIMMLSKCFLGGTPDGMTVLKSDLLKLLERQDKVLADKGTIYFTSKINCYLHTI